MSKSEPYKVVRIISPYKVVINAGLDDGLKEGSRFLIYELGEMLKDPDSGEDLEQVEIVRGTGKLVHLQNKIATIASNMEEKKPITITRKSTLGSMRHIFGDTEQKEVNREEIPFDEPQIGDLARHE